MCGNFVEKHSFHRVRVSGNCAFPQTFQNQEIKWNCGISPSVSRQPNPCYASHDTLQTTQMETLQKLSQSKTYCEILIGPWI